jgi:aerobic-type carbon monoxide dehydrogenase small subunit (CoxS/CutS family)
MNVTMTLNGAQRAVAVESDETLLAVLRRLGLRSVRETCGIGVCGSCTVLVDGRAMTGCLLLAPLVDGSTVVTAEGLADDPLVAAFADSHAFQCGWCIPGFVVAARGLLDENPAPNEHEAKEALAGNLCRCGSYLKILDAVQRAAAVGP